MVATVKTKIVRIILAAMLVTTLLGPVVSAPVYAGECDGAGSTACSG